MATIKITVNKKVSLKVEADVAIVAREWYAYGLQGHKCPFTVVDVRTQVTLNTKHKPLNCHPLKVTISNA